MRRALALIASTAMVLSVAGAAAAARQDNPKVTGGGQIDVSTSGGGAGNTLTFYGEELAEGTGDRGQVQYVPTSTGGGSSEGYWHGFVNCVQIEGDRARVSGLTTKGTNFWLDVIDNPSGGNPDLIRLNDDSDSTCEEEDDDARNTQLGRGEAVVHNGGS